MDLLKYIVRNTDHEEKESEEEIAANQVHDKPIEQPSNDWVMLGKMARAYDTLQDLEEPLNILLNSISEMEQEARDIYAKYPKFRCEACGDIQQHFDIVTRKLRNQMADVNKIYTRYR